MADTAISSLSVSSGSQYVRTGRVYGEAVAVGDWLYRNTTDSKLWTADCLAADTAVVEGIALVAGDADDQAVWAAPGAVIDIGSGLVVGVYILSEDGAMCPVADLAASDFITVLGVAQSTSLFAINVFASGVQK